MDDRAALFTNVLDQPADDTARVVLADWLEEHGEDQFGRFLRAGVVASRYRDAEHIDDPDYYAALAEIAAITKSGAPARWLSTIGVGPSPLTDGDWSWDNAADCVTVRVGATAGVFARGLLSELSVALGEWYTLAPVALASWPLEVARVTDVPGLTFAVAPAEGGWRLRGRLRVPGRRVPLFGRALVPAAVAPAPFIAQAEGDWWAEELFPDRRALVEGVATASARLVDDLREVAGDRWPSPPRKR